jgi:hypothetical protein
LNVLFIGEKQIGFTWESIYWFTKAVRQWQIALMHRAVPIKLIQADYGKHCHEDPLLRGFGYTEQFYDTPLIKVDLWRPDYKTKYIPCFFPRNGYAGKWFTELPSVPGQYWPQHFSPNEYYKFFMPQMLMRHLALETSLVSLESGLRQYWIGAG